MLIKKITYKDFNGMERTEDFMFHLMESEIAEMELSTAGGFAESLEKIVQTQNVPEIIKEFKKIPGSNEIINKCLDFTREVILDIFKPKCVVCLSVPDCFDNLNRRFRFSEIKRIFTLQETDANLIDFAKQKKDKGWNNPYQCRRIIKKGFWNGIPVYGIPHPSGRVSNDDMGAIALYLRSEMQKLGI